MLAALPVQDCRVVIVENKVNLDKLPAMPRTLALGGLGYGIVRLFEIPWLATNRSTIGETSTSKAWRSWRECVAGFRIHKPL